MASRSVARAMLPAMVDYAAPHPVSTAVRFFRAYPRIGPHHAFADSPDYYRSVALVLVPYACAALVISLLSLLIFALSHRKAGASSATEQPRSPEQRQQQPQLQQQHSQSQSQSLPPLPSSANLPRHSNFSAVTAPSDQLVHHRGASFSSTSPPRSTTQRDVVATVYLLFSAFLNMSLYAAAGLALVNILAFRSAASYASDAITAAEIAAHSSLATPASVLLRLARHAAEAAPDYASLAFLRESANDLSHLRAHGLAQVAASQSLHTVLDRLVLLTSVPVLALAGGVAAFGGFCAAVADRATASRRARRRVTRVAMFAVLLLPAVAAWLLAGAAAAAAVATADLCTELTGFHAWVRTPSGVPPGNALQTVGLACTNASKLVDVARSLVDAPAARSEAFEADLYAMLRAMAEEGDSDGASDFGKDEWERVRTQLSDGLADAAECGMQRRLAGHLSFAFCSARSGAGVSTLTQTWLVGCAMALLYIGVVLLPAAKHPVAEHVTAVELQRIAGKAEYYHVGDDGVRRGGDEEMARRRRSSMQKRSEWSAEESTWSSEDGLYIEGDLDADVSSTVFDDARHFGQIEREEGLSTSDPPTDVTISPAPP